METQEKKNKLETKSFIAERVDENTVTVTRKVKNKNSAHEVDVYIFSPHDIAELRSVKTSSIQDSNHFFETIFKSFKSWIGFIPFFR